MIEVAKLGKAVGLKGFVKLHILSDFPEQFQPGRVYHSRAGDLEIESANNRGEVRFKGYDTREEAARLTNLVLASTEEESRSICELGEDEYLWDDIIGLDVYEGDTLLGRVSEIERFPSEDHLLIQCADTIASRYGLKRFLLPYAERSIVSTDLKASRLNVTGALDILAVLSE